MAYPRTYLEIFLYVFSAILLPFPERRDPIQEYDFIVVGAGSAGSALASRLSEDPKIRVLLLEAGGIPSRISTIPLLADHQWNSTYSWNYVTTPQNSSCLGFANKSCFWPRGKLLGGTSEINGMIYVRGNRADYDEWAQLGIKGWSYDDVLPYFKKAENVTINNGIIETDYHGINGPVTVSEAQHKTAFYRPFMDAARSMGYENVDYNGKLQIGFAHPQVNIRTGQRCGTFKAYLQPAALRDNIDIIANAIARKINFNSDKTAKSVEYVLDGKNMVAYARKEIILSAGAIATPQLLMLSGVGPKEDLQKLNISVVADLPVGLNLQDHVASLGLSFVTNVSRTVQWKYAVNPRTVNRYLLRKKGPLTVPCGIDAIGFIRTDSLQNLSQVPDTQIYLIPQDFNAHLPKDFVRPYTNKHIITLMNSPLKPKSVGRVTLRSSNPNDPPLIDPQHLSHPDDLPVMIAGMRFVLNMAQSKSMKHLDLSVFNTTISGCEDLIKWSDDYLGCMARHLTFSLSHNVGTCKMGDVGDPETVVDSELRVKGIKNLRVADASIIPRIISGNTNAPAIMIGERAADLIRGVKSI